MNRKTIVRWISGGMVGGALVFGSLASQGAFAQTPSPSTEQTAPSTEQTAPGTGAQPRPDRQRGPGRGGKLGLAQATADVTGLTLEQVRAELAAGKTYADIAAANGKTADDVVKAAVAALKTELDAAVAAGTLTQAQADARLAEAQTRASEQVALSAPAGGRGGPGGPGGGRGERGGFGRGGKVNIVKATADVTGLTVEAVRAELAAGKSPAQVAEANGKTADDVVSAAVAPLKTELAADVAAGELTQAEADTRLADATARAKEQAAQAGLPQGGRGDHKRGGQDLVAATAEVTGLTVEEVRAELAAGKSLAQIAEAKGKTVDEVIANLQAKGNERLTQRLEEARTQMAVPGGR